MCSVRYDAGSEARDRSSEYINQAFIITMPLIKTNSLEQSPSRETSTVFTRGRHKQCPERVVHAP